MNAAGGGCHVRSGELSPFGAESCAWLGPSSRKVSLVDHEGGTLYIVAR